MNEPLSVNVNNRYHFQVNRTILLIVRAPKDIQTDEPKSKEHFWAVVKCKIRFSKYTYIYLTLTTFIHNISFKTFIECLRLLLEQYAV